MPSRPSAWAGWAARPCPRAAGEFIWGREGEILRCPWHGWEFDLNSGQCLTDRRRLKRFPVVIRDDAIYVEV